jgi:hypothetical protein
MIDNVVYMELDSDMDLLVNSDRLWSVFESEFGMTYGQIKSLIKSMVEKHFKTGSLKPIPHQFITYQMADENFKTGSLNEGLNLPKINKKEITIQQAQKGDTLFVKYWPKEQFIKNGMNEFESNILNTGDLIRIDDVDHNGIIINDIDNKGPHIWTGADVFGIPFNDIFSIFRYKKEISEGLNLPKKDKNQWGKLYKITGENDFISETISEEDVITFAKHLKESLNNPDIIEVKSILDAKILLSIHGYNLHTIVPKIAFDKNGDVFDVGDNVIVDQPDNNDELYSNEFEGRVDRINFPERYATIIDSDDGGYDIDWNHITLVKN